MAALAAACAGVAACAAVGFDALPKRRPFVVVTVRQAAVQAALVCACAEAPKKERQHSKRAADVRLVPRLCIGARALGCTR